MNRSACAISQVRGPLILIAEFAKPDFQWLNGLRLRHYPADRNRVPAHLTLFRSLPPSAESEIRRSVANAAAMPGPRAEISGVMDLDTGVALRVCSPQLETIRDELRYDFHGLLSAQDTGRWTPHVTVQNKAEPKIARELYREMQSGFEVRPLKITGLRIVRYVEGEWEPLAGYRFR